MASTRYSGKPVHYYVGDRVHIFTTPKRPLEPDLFKHRTLTQAFMGATVHVVHKNGRLTIICDDNVWSYCDAGSVRKGEPPNAL